MNKIAEKLKSLFINVTPLRFSIIVGILNLVLYHKPLFKFIFEDIDLRNPKYIITIISIALIVLIANALIIYLMCLISRIFTKIIWSIFFILNAAAMYFIATFKILVEITVISNVLNTNVKEATSFISTELILYILFLGILPSIYIFFTKISKVKFTKALKHIGCPLISLIVICAVNIIPSLKWAYLNQLVLTSNLYPWTYVANAQIYYRLERKNNRVEHLLPDGKIKNNDKAVVILVIGESARSNNFSLYGYKRNTNPLLSKIKDLHTFKAHSEATYTIAGVKAMLEDKEHKELYECLTSYLHRTGAYVIWRTTNNGQPKMKIDKYMDADSLAKIPSPFRKNYDEVLLSGLKEEIMAATKDKVLIVLHTGTSHGAKYSMHYPKEFEIYSPVNTTTALEKWDRQYVINAYDNTIVYTDYILNNVINILKEIPGVHSTMMYVSDHGESLGENGIYMHGLSRRLAPDEQRNIPFIVWQSDNYRTLKHNDELSQHHVFHSVLNFLSVESPVYQENLNIFK